MHQKLCVFSGSKCKIFSARWEGGHPPRILFSEASKYRSFPEGSLAKHYYEYIWNGMLKAWCYRHAPLLFGGNNILVIFAQNMHQKLFFRAQNATFSLPWKGGVPTHDISDNIAKRFKK